MGTVENLSSIKYVKGDLFDHVEGFSGYTIIPHIVNNIGAWGSGFVIPLGKKFPSSKKMYLKHWESFKLGQVLMVNCAPVYIAHMFAQEGISSLSTGPHAAINSKPIRYVALIKCLEEIRNVVDNSKVPCRIVAPKFGSLRSGGSWAIIEALIEEVWAGLDVTIIEFGE